MAVATAKTVAGSEYLRPVSSVGTINLAAASGERTIYNDGNDIFGWVDGDFSRWGANEPGNPTDETPTTVFEMVKDADFQTMFGSLVDSPADVEKLALSQDQILNFVENNRAALRSGGYATFFLFKSGEKLFVAFVLVRVGGSLGVFVLGFSFGLVWGGGGRRRVVVPQTI